MTRVIIESLVRPKAKGIIEGVALVPTFSLNNNGYIPEVAEMNGDRCVPIDWNHDQRENAGNVCFTYNKESRELLYKGRITDDFILSEVEKFRESGQEMHVSIEANVTESQEVCSSRTCYNIAIAMEITRMAITPTPGVSSTTLKLIESAPEHQVITIEKDDDIKSKLEEINRKLDILIPKDVCPDCGK